MIYPFPFFPTHKSASAIDACIAYLNYYTNFKLKKMLNKITFLIAIMLLTISTSFAQIKNSKTDTLKVYGNCEMCKEKIEKAGTQKNISKVIWNAETSMATITYDAKKTTADAILKRIALVGYDSEKFFAADAVYKKLPGCCKYDRPVKKVKTS